MSVLFLMGLFSSAVWAYPEFQEYSKKVSKRPINCAMCHTHPDGPEGVKVGQIGRLNAEELNDLGLARQAFLPGKGVKNPILNEFGNVILNDLGKDKIVELRQSIEHFAAALSQTSDLDHDGISDAEEFLDGTHPVNSLDGHPWKLFKNNFAKNWFHILMMILATGFGLFSLNNLLHWLSSKADREK